MMIVKHEISQQHESNGSIMISNNKNHIQKNNMFIIILLLLLINTHLSFSQQSTTNNYEESNNNNYNNDNIFICPIYVFVPFTNNGTASRPLSGQYNKTNSTNNNTRDNNPALSHLAAALLAVNTFNTQYGTCNNNNNKNNNNTTKVQLQIEHVFDTGTIGHDASRQFYNMQQQQQNGTTKPLCAIAGAFNDIPALELSTIASSIQIPIVIPQAYNVRVTLDEYSPYTTQTYPDLQDNIEKLIQYAIHLHRTNYISFIYTTSDVNIQRREILQKLLHEYNISWETHPLPPIYNQIFTSTLSPLSKDNNTTTTPIQSIVLEIIQTVKHRGYRTIIIAMENSYIEFPYIANAIQALNMDNGEYVYFWCTPIDPIHVHNPIYNKLIHGSGLVLPAEKWVLLREQSKNVEDDIFLHSWINQGIEQVERLNNVNPILPNEIGYAYAQPNYFQTYRPEWGAGYLYDAIITIGLGACNMIEKHNDDNEQQQQKQYNGYEHLQGIRQVDYINGATGHVQFLNDRIRSGSRISSYINWAGINLRTDRSPPFLMTDVFLASNNNNNKWEQITSFIYADNTTIPPKYLRDIPEQNYLSEGLHIFGLLLMSIVFMTGIMSIIWVCWNQNHRVLAASQPIFLYILCFGCIIQASTILPLSFDESYGWTDESLTAACTSIPWLFALGHILTYGALFSKLWRVNKVLQFARRRIKMRQVVWPLSILFIGAIVILTIWTAIDPKQWERNEVDDITGESIGQCAGNDYFLVPLIILVLIPTVLTLIMAWKTKDVNDDFSEAKWIWILIIVQFEVFLVSAPTIILLRDVSTDGRYIGSAFLLFIFPMSALLLIMVPKYISHRKHKLGIVQRSKRRGGNGVSGGGVVHVSGVSPSVASSHIHNPNSIVQSTSEFQQQHQYNNTNNTTTNVLPESSTKNNVDDNYNNNNDNIDNRRSIESKIPPEISAKKNEENNNHNGEDLECSNDNDNKILDADKNENSTNNDKNDKFDDENVVVRSGSQIAF